MRKSGLKHLPLNNRGVLVFAFILAFISVFNSSWAEPNWETEEENLTILEREFLLKVARNRIREFYGEKPDILVLPVASSLDKKSAGVFVTLDINNRVVGCRGSLYPTKDNIVEEIKEKALSASMGDPHHPPLSPQWLEKVRISITLIISIIPVQEVEGIQKSQGILVKQGNRVGVVLPYEGSHPQTRLSWGYKKAQIPEDEPAEIYVIRAIRFAEGDI